jgi:hypothetical protein
LNETGDEIARATAMDKRKVHLKSCCGRTGIRMQTVCLAVAHAYEVDCSGFLWSAESGMQDVLHLLQDARVSNAKAQQIFPPLGEACRASKHYR